MSGQWKIPWVGSTGDPGQRSGIWEAAGQTRTRGVSAGAGRSGPAGAKERDSDVGRAGRQGRWAAWAGLTSGSAAVATAAPSSSAEAVSQPRPQGQAGGDSRGRDHRGSDGSGTVGPVALGSRRAAAAHPPPCQRDSARPGQAHPPPHPPSTRCTAASTGVAASAGARGCLRSRVSASWLDSQQPQPTAAASQSAPARAPPTPRTRPRPARLLGCRRAGARALTSHAPYRLRDPARPAPARDGTSEYNVRLRGHAPSQLPLADTPRLIGLRRPRPNFSSSLYGTAGSLCLRGLERNVAMLGVENSGFATVALLFRPVQSCLEAGRGGEARSR